MIRRWRPPIIWSRVSSAPSDEGGLKSPNSKWSYEIELFPRHREEPLRRSNPFSPVRRIGLLRCARNDAFKHPVSLAITNWRCQMPLAVDSSPFQYAFPEMEMPSDPNAKWRVRIAFVLLFVVLAVGAYFAAELSHLQESMTARESPMALRGVTDARQIDEALKRHPQNNFLLLIAMVTKAADATNAAIEQLSNEIAPPGVSRNIDFGAASQSELEALRRDLKTAEVNATTFLPRYTALLKAERDNVQEYARSHVDKVTADRLLQSIDRRQTEITALTSRSLSARADLYRAYDSLRCIHGPRGRSLQDRQRSNRIPASIHREPLQCRGRCHDGCSKPCCRTGQRGKSPVGVAAGAMDTVHQRQMTGRAGI